MNFFLIIIFLSLVEFVGDASFRQYAKDPKLLDRLLLGILAYIGVVLILIQSFKQANLIFTNGMWDGVSAAIGTILAVFILNESLTNGYQWSGLTLVILGIVLLNIGKIPN